MWTDIGDLQLMFTKKISNISAGVSLLTRGKSFKNLKQCEKFITI